MASGETPQSTFLKVKSNESNRTDSASRGKSPGSSQPEWSRSSEPSGYTDSLGSGHQGKRPRRSTSSSSLSRPGTPQRRLQFYSSTGSETEYTGSGVFSMSAAFPPCVVTNRRAAVKETQLVNESDGLRLQLEWAWGLERNSLQLDSEDNKLQLRADWKYLFDEEEWMLIPASADISRLIKATEELEDEMKQYEKLLGLSETTSASQDLINDPLETVKESLSVVPEHPGKVVGGTWTKPTWLDIKRMNIEDLFRSQSQFEYHFLPMLTMKEPICRSITADSDEHKEFTFPFEELGTLQSRVKPQFVAYDTGMKLLRMPSRDIQNIVKKVFPQNQLYPNVNTLESLQRIYSAWTRWQVPSDFIKPQIHDADKNECQAAIRLFPSVCGDQASLDSSNGSSIEQDWDEAAWRRGMARWVKNSAEAADREGGWESNLVNDDQLGNYRKHRTRIVPSEEYWRLLRRKYPGLPGMKKHKMIDTSLFTSTDWAMYEGACYLLRKCQ
ncbi:hypothetical protein J3A83DRAFT_4331269 [Scleroderma citrinum]